MKIIKNEIQNSNPNQKAAPESKDPRHPKVLAAARMYEQVFIGQMVKAMRETVGKSDLIQENMAEKIFKDQLYDNYTESWTQKGGVGLADIIYEEVMEKYQASRGIKPQGPLPVDKQNFYKTESQGTDKKIEFKMTPQDNNTQSSIVMPWDGMLTQAYKTESGESVLDFEFENGLKGKMLFSGTLTPDKGLFKAGETVADLKPGSKLYMSLVKS